MELDARQRAYVAQVIDFRGAKRGDNPFDLLAAKLRQLGYSTYAEYRADDHWRAVRDQVVSKRWVPGGCQVCRTIGSVNIHHLTYARLGQENDADLVLLCADCHEATHLLVKHGAHLGTAVDDLARLTTAYIERSERRFNRRVAGGKFIENDAHGHRHMARRSFMQDVLPEMLDLASRLARERYPSGQVHTRPKTRRSKRY